MPGGNKGYEEHKPKEGHINDKAAILYFMVRGGKIIKKLNRMKAQALH